MPRKKKRYEIASVLVCDDVRQERNGKEIIIGLYNEAIILSSFPGQLQSLAFRIALRPLISDIEKFTVSVRKKSTKESVINLNADITAPLSVGEPNIISFAVANPKFTEPGQFEILFAADDEKPSVVSTFEVRGPKTDEERGRFSS